MYQKRDGFKNERFFMIPEAYFRNNALIQNCYVTNIGYFPLARHHYRERPDGAEEYLLLYCAEGAGSIRLASNPAYALRPGFVSVLPAKTAHIYYASEDNPWSIFWIHLDGKFLDVLWENGYLGKPKYLQTNSRLILETLFNECFDILKQTYSAIDYYYVCQIVSHILGVVSSAATDTITTEKSENAVISAITYMKQNLDKTLTLAQLAQVCHYSPSYLNALFKQLKQSTPVRYFIQMKIQAASKDLYFSKTPVKTVARRYGFDDPLYFSRLFKKTFGVSPTEYRNQQRG